MEATAAAIRAPDQGHRRCCLAAVLAATVTAAVGIRDAPVGNGDPSLVALEPGGSKAHHSTLADAWPTPAAVPPAGARPTCGPTAPGAPRCPARRPRLRGRAGVGTGSWGAPFGVASWPIHQILLPTGKVLWLTYADDHEKGGRAFVWDPATGQTREVDPPRSATPTASPGRLLG